MGPTYALVEALFGGFADCPGGESDIARLGDLLGTTFASVVELCSSIDAGRAAGATVVLAAAGDGAEATEPAACSGGGAEAAEPLSGRACLAAGGAEASR